jgi:beta-galactosidase
VDEQQVGDSRRWARLPTEVGRRRFLQVVLGGGAIGLAAWEIADHVGSNTRDADTAVPRVAGTTSPGPEGSAEGATVTGPGAFTVPFNSGWLFGPASAESSLPGFDDSEFVTATLPHTVAPLSWRNWDPDAWEQVWAYRKHFDQPAGTSGMRVFLDFGAAMTHATVTLNGSEVADYLGGYLPFSADITAALKPTGNVLAVRLDSTFNHDVPPDRPAPAVSSSVDFWQPGGIYRDVQLRVVPQAFLADVFAKPVNVLTAQTRQVVVQVTVDAAAAIPGDAQIAVALLDGTRTVASDQITVAITGAGRAAATMTLSGLSDITLWDIGNPKLYTVVTTLALNGRKVHEYQVRIGFREATFTTDGFYLNGRRVKLFGVNRHQFFPYAGGAMPDRVQAQDARIIRYELNCNMVRCSHYPQSAAFLDACDEIGLLAWEEAPGWGYLGDDGWATLSYRDIEDMIVRDRNHPSVIIWGTRLNETPDDAPFYTSTNELARALDDSRPTAGAMAGQWMTTDYQQDVFAENDYSSVTHAAGTRQPVLQPPVDGVGRPYLVTEAVGTLSGPAIYYRRTDIQAVQQGQSVAHAQVHNQAGSDDRYCGLLAWSGFDYPSGNGNQYQGVKYTGVVDEFRTLKPGAAIYQAQTDPRVTPVIAPAFYWDFGPVSPVTSLADAMICSNLDRLEVYVGGEHFATVTPDATDYASLAYPPSFVNFAAVDGSSRPDLRIDGYLGPTQVASRSFAADSSGDRLMLTADDTEIDGDGVDTTRLAFRALDRYGNPRPYAGGQVTFQLAGPAVLMSDNPFDLASAGGAGAVWIRSLPGSPGTVTLTASHPTLGTTAARIQVREVPQAGLPVPYGTLRVQAVPGLVPPGGTTTVTATFTNNSALTLDGVQFTGTVPGDWTVTVVPTVIPGELPSGEVVQAEWHVVVPADGHLGQAPVTVQATYTAQGQRGVTNASISVLGGYATLADAFNNTGISADAAAAAANFDGTGASYSEQALTTAGFGPGAVLTHDRLVFTWPDVPAGQPDNVISAGQTILLSGSGTTLGFLGAAGSGGQSDSGTIYYTDGTTSKFKLALGSYLGSPAAGTETVAVLPYFNRAAGQSQRDAYVFYAGVPITPNKTVQAVTLPGKGFASASGIHIFAIALGPLVVLGAQS